MRHAFTLQAKASQFYLGLVQVPPGFVEPNPEFFARMAQLLETTMDRLEEKRCFQPSAWGEAERLRELVAYLRGLGASDPSTGAGVDYLWMWEIADEISDPDFRFADPKYDPTGFDEKSHGAIAALEAKIKVLENGNASVGDRASLLRDRWTKLTRSARLLESLAHKQLRGETWSPSEERFLKGYGEEMAFVMGYFGNSWLTPRDDAPRSAEVAGFPVLGKTLSAAVGRPRHIYILYPWRGMDILCAGSVMQYYEFESERPLTDEQWLEHLDSPAAPIMPEWMSPFAIPPAKPKDDGY